jgi:hypothetical protein
VKAGDLPAVRLLHDELFPVKYDEDFYNNLLDPSRISLVAVNK